MTRKYTKEISLEKIYERLLEESESNPMVLLVKQDCADAIATCFGYNYNSAYRKADELGREYNLNLCLNQDLRRQPCETSQRRTRYHIHKQQKSLLFGFGIYAEMRIKRESL